jgi:hypothetical protein
MSINAHTVDFTEEPVRFEALPDKATETLVVKVAKGYVPRFSRSLQTAWDYVGADNSPLVGNRISAGQHRLQAVAVPVPQYDDPSSDLPTGLRYAVGIVSRSGVRQFESSATGNRSTLWTGVEFHRQGIADNSQERQELLVLSEEIAVSLARHIERQAEGRILGELAQRPGSASARPDALSPEEVQARIVGAGLLA